MVNTPPSKSPDELFAALEAIDEDENADTSPAALASSSARSMLDERGVQYRVLNARFTGDLPAQHEIGVSPATLVLGELQNALAEIGASVIDSVPKRGPLPAEVLAATELRFSPHVSPGSVIFALQPVQRESELWSDDSSTLLEKSLEKLFEVFGDIERPKTSGTTLDTVPDLLKSFGPRTAVHLFNFANALSSDGLNLDFGWLRSGHQDVRSRLSKAGAAYLGQLAKKATTRTLPVTLRGQVQNLGVDNNHRFKDDELGEIGLHSTPEITDQLVETFKKGRVEISADETETVNLVTGKSKKKFEASSIRPIDDEAADAT